MTEKHGRIPRKFTISPEQPPLFGTTTKPSPVDNSQETAKPSESKSGVTIPTFKDYSPEELKEFYGRDSRGND